MVWTQLVFHVIDCGLFLLHAQVTADSNSAAELTFQQGSAIRHFCSNGCQPPRRPSVTRVQRTFAVILLLDLTGQTESEGCRGGSPSFDCS